MKISVDINQWLVLSTLSSEAPKCSLILCATNLPEYPNTLQFINQDREIFVHRKFWALEARCHLHEKYVGVIQVTHHHHHQKTRNFYFAPLLAHWINIRLKSTSLFPRKPQEIEGLETFIYCCV